MKKGEKQAIQNNAEIFVTEQAVNTSTLVMIEKTEPPVTGVEVIEKDRRDFSTVFARLKKSARKRSVSIL